MQTRNRAHSRPLAGWKGSAEPAVSTGLPGANLFGSIYNVDQLKLSPSSPSSSSFCKLRTLPARRFCFVFDTTQNHIFSCLITTKKCCASVSSCPDPRLDLLTHHECHTASPLRPQVWPGRTRPGRAPTSSNPQVPLESRGGRLKDRSDTKKMMARPETNKQHPKMSWIARRRVMRVCVDVQ